MEGTDSVWVIIRELHRVAQLQRRAAAESPLGPVPLGLLNLAAQKPVSPSDAAKELQVPPQSITRAVADLMAAGLVCRVGNATDGRSYSLELTEAGLQARADFRRQLSADFSRLLADWDQQEIDVFANQLGRLVDALATDAADGQGAALTANPWRQKVERQ
ncbi:MarR family winged helix-turn-helix transcriptional regulator [Tsukamurella sp. 1534]|uniref:MarR family winged helix-turn-helix transcriptional regulator n=1 Tax=Tsukamurella sp. 1534 TaxID=1151061 RepID=UPI0009DB4B7B|nr:MarR family winged helix-turn-helix transcriptional regulator [Tsukamurella sp. 1534]